MRWVGWGVAVGLFTSIQIGHADPGLWVGALIATVCGGAVRQAPIRPATARWWTATVVALELAAIVSLWLAFDFSRCAAAVLIFAAGATIWCLAMALDSTARALAIPRGRSGVIALVSTTVLTFEFLLLGIGALTDPSAIATRAAPTERLTLVGYGYAARGWYTSGVMVVITIVAGLTSVITLGTTHRWMAKALDRTLGPAEAAPRDLPRV
jgi:hypothetical protein